MFRVKPSSQAVSELFALLLKVRNVASCLYCDGELELSMKESSGDNSVMETILVRTGSEKLLETKIQCPQF